MNALAVAACCIAGSALIAALPRRPVARHRLGRLRLGAVPAGRGERRDRRGLIAGLAGVLAGVGVAVVVGDWLGLVGGGVAAVVTTRALRRLESPALRRARMQASVELPFATDLLAAGLRAGAPTAAAVTAVADVCGGPLGQRLDRVAGALWLGTPAGEAWAYVADVDGASRVVTAAVRASESGAALANALTRVSDDLRAGRAAHAEAAARRAGVLVVLPLGLCFLPAFVIAGLIPLVIAVLRQVTP